MNKKIITAGLSVVMFLGMVTAQVSLQITSGDVDPNGQASSCVTLVNNLRYKMKDATTDGEVTSLQDFLIANNFMSGESTGYFGAGTLKAVKLFQMKKGLSPTGYVGPLTRENIKKMSCDTMVLGDTIPTDPAGGVVTSSSTCLTAAMMTPKMCPDGRPVPQDSQTCQLLEWKCSNSVIPVTDPASKKIPVVRGCNHTDLQGNCYGYDPLPPAIVRGTTTGSIILSPKNKIYPVYCTMEMRFCPNGAPMSRGPGCGWHPELCQGVADRSVDVSGGVSSPTAKDGTVINPMYTVPSKTSDAVEINQQNTYSPKYQKLPATTITSPVVKTICTMQARLCPNGDRMYRDEMCGWHEEKCQGTTSTGIQCSKDPFSGELFCGAPGTAPASY